MLLCVVGQNATWLHTSNTRQTNSAQAIVIPKRVKRDPLSVLRALSGTVQKDCNSPMHIAIDDPLLLSAEQNSKKLAFIARAQGRRAAHYALKEHPQWFQVSPIQPTLDMDALLEAYKPPSGYEHEDDTLDGLLERIKLRSPVEAYMSYQKIQVKGEEVSSEVIHDLLDLLTFYNSSEPEETVMPEELYYAKTLSKAEIQPSSKSHSTWQNSGAAEQLFNSMNEKTERAFNSLLRGRAKYNDHVGAFSLYEEMLEKQIPVSIGSFKALLSLVNLSGSELTFAPIQSLFEEMTYQNVEPDADVFGLALRSLFRMYNMGAREDNQTVAFSLLSEMQRLNIEPSLSWWGHMMDTLIVRGRFSHLCNAVIDHLQGRPLTATTPDDYKFFSTAMVIAGKKLKDMELASKIDKLLNTGRNYKLIGDNTRLHIYYFNYFQLLCTFEQADKIIAEYERLVPQTFTPVKALMVNLLETLEMNDAIYFLPRIWLDIRAFSYVKAEQITEKFFTVATSADRADTKLVQDLAVTADEFVAMRHDYMMRSGYLLGSLMHVFLNAGKHPEAWKLFEIYHNNRHFIAQFPSEESLSMMCESALAQQQPFSCVKMIVEVMAEAGHGQIEVIVNKLFKELEMTDEEKDELDNLL